MEGGDEANVNENLSLKVD